MPVAEKVISWPNRKSSLSGIAADALTGPGADQERQRAGRLGICPGFGPSAQR